MATDKDKIIWWKHLSDNQKESYLEKYFLLFNPNDTEIIFIYNNEDIKHKPDDFSVIIGGTKGQIENPGLYDIRRDLEFEKAWQYNLGLTALAMNPVELRKSDFRAGWMAREKKYNEFIEQEKQTDIYWNTELNKSYQKEVARQEIDRKVKSILSEHQDLNIEDVTDDSDIINDLGADNFDEIEIIMEMEKDFDIKIEDDECFRKDILTVKNLVDMIFKMKNN
jgi:acyl carrier protein